MWKVWTCFIPCSSVSIANFEQVNASSDDAAETWELVGIFMLSLLSKRYNSKDAGLYHEGG